MFFSDRITLQKTESESTGSYMQPVVKSSVAVYTNVKSLARSEFYSAMAAGQKYDIAFEVHAEDWGNQNQIVYDGATYSIERTYQKNGSIIELVCQKRGAL
jgi:SPP1 family predicted phage head-tail adaptor